MRVNCVHTAILSTALMF